MVSKNFMLKEYLYEEILDGLFICIHPLDPNEHIYNNNKKHNYYYYDLSKMEMLILESAIYCID